ncbi:carbon starvation protein A [Cetobacterium somerae]|uniref:carbon starvation CstA family protein n=1 Tax=Cetobacterium sp. NK01 TaxID=2993530 RepID=UPI002116F07A|nr:carbon starvation CstA family protein [Cetobacterium sp. NK01]MCQ8211336.1 carbon starvation protein A [Cetobacterium sp. NK01]
MKSYFLGVFILIVAYCSYGKYLEKNFEIDERETPAFSKADGVDFVQMNYIKSFLVQFLNIAGLGPITGAVAGAMWGSSSFIWIVFGTIFAGAVHDYYTGMISMRNDGENMQELIGKYLGKRAKIFTKYFLVILLIIVGVAFITGPAEILQSFTGVDKKIWLILIVGYYIIATLLPIDKIIGKIYPLFGGALVLMMFLLIGAMLIKGIKIPEVTLENLHPRKLPIFPYMFVVISCGAISGFHSTQSVLVARCLKSEKDGKKTFMAAMYLEGFVALTWAAISLGFFNGVEGLAASGGGMIAVSKMITGLLGKYGLIFTLFGLIALPITTGDTAFRSARVTIAEVLNYKQISLKNRLLVAIPLFLLAGFLSQFGFNTLWKYVASTNQLLATLGLWTCTYYFIENRKNYWITGIPAAFMTGMVACYFLVAPEGLKVENTYFIYSLGVVVFILTLIVIGIKGAKVTKKIEKLNI